MLSKVFYWVGWANIAFGVLEVTLGVWLGAGFIGIGCIFHEISRSKTFS